MSKFEYCIPVYNGKDTWHTVEGYNAENAAENVARHYNEDGDYPLMNEASEFVLIRKDEESPIQIFVMSAEPSIEYYASEKTEIKCYHCKKNLKPHVIDGSAYSSDGRFFCSYDCSRRLYQERHEAWLKEWKKES